MRIAQSHGARRACGCVIAGVIWGLRLRDRELAFFRVWAPRSVTLPEVAAVAVEY
jgi:hypothetical protein